MKFISANYQIIAIIFVTATNAVLYDTAIALYIALFF